MKPYKQTISKCFSIKQNDQIRKICTELILFNHLITFKDFSSVLISQVKKYIEPCFFSDYGLLLILNQM